MYNANEKSKEWKNWLKYQMLSKNILIGIYEETDQNIPDEKTLKNMSSVLARILIKREIK